MVMNICHYYNDYKGLIKYCVFLKTYKLSIVDNIT